MQLTRKASYGLIAVVALARRDETTPVPAGTIATDYGLPAPFLEKILHEMKRAGLVRSRAGRGGGYILARPAESVSVRDVLQALGEPIDLVQCLDPASATCRIAGCCPTQRTWHSINGRFRELLASLSVADLDTELLPSASPDAGAINHGDACSSRM